LQLSELSFSLLKLSCRFNVNGDRICWNR